MNHLERENRALRAEVERLTRFRNLAYRDPLTGLYNRRCLEERALEEFARARKEREFVGLATFDVDRFKEVNDTLGHAAGDQVLQEIAQVLSRNARRSDVVCRWGGDEFAVLLPATGLWGTEAFVKRVTVELSTIAIPLTQDALQISASPGIAVYPEDGSRLDDLFERADENLYEVKASRRRNASGIRAHPDRFPAAGPGHDVDFRRSHERVSQIIARAKG